MLASVFAYYDKVQTNHESCFKRVSSGSESRPYKRRLRLPFIACWWTISLECLEPKGCLNNESWQFENSFKMFGFTRSDETNRWIAPPLHINCAATCNNYLSGLVSVYSYCSSFQELFSSTNNSSMFPFQLITMCMDELQISSLASGWVFVFLSSGLCSENSWLLLAAGTFHDQNMDVKLLKQNWVIYSCMKWLRQKYWQTR